MIQQIGASQSRGYNRADKEGMLITDIYTHKFLNLVAQLYDMAEVIVTCVLPEIIW